MDFIRRVGVDMSTSKDKPYRFFLSNEEVARKCDEHNSKAIRKARGIAEVTDEMQEGESFIDAMLTAAKKRSSESGHYHCTNGCDSEPIIDYKDLLVKYLKFTEDCGDILGLDKIVIESDAEWKDFTEDCEPYANFTREEYILLRQIAKEAGLVLK